MRGIIEFDIIINENNNYTLIDSVHNIFFPQICFNKVVHAVVTRQWSQAYSAQSLFTANYQLLRWPRLASFLNSSNREQSVISSIAFAQELVWL